MASDGLPATPPAQLKAIQTFFKIAQDVERVDPVVSYWLRLHSTETALKIDRESPECKSFLSALIVWLEKFKATHKDNEAVTNQTVGQAHYENFAMALFNKADNSDRSGVSDMRTVRMFFMATILFEAMSVFGTPTDDINQKAKYAKFKAAYIQKCLKTGQTPKPGPVDGPDLEGTSQGEDASTQNPTSDKDSTPSKPPPLSLPSGGPPPADKSNDKSTAEFTFKPSMPPAMPAMPPAMPSPKLTDLKQTGGSGQKPTGSATDGSISGAKFTATNGTPLGPEAIILGQKYCKFANSALQYDDIPTAVENLQKALKLLTTGQNPS